MREWQLNVSREQLANGWQEIGSVWANDCSCLCTLVESCYAVIVRAGCSGQVELKNKTIARKIDSHN